MRVIKLICFVTEAGIHKHLHLRVCVCVCVCVCMRARECVYAFMHSRKVRICI